MIASASQFHTRFDTRLVEDPAVAAANDAFLTNVEGRLAAEEAELSVKPALRAELGEDAHRERVAAALAFLPRADLELSAMLLKRDAFTLADALEPMAGRVEIDPSLSNQYADESVRDALGHRPRNERRIGIDLAEIALGHDLAALDHEQAARFARRIR